jgi:hypothetical protein
MGFVYLIQAYDTLTYKIGVSKNNPNGRLKQLSTGNHSELRIIETYESRHYRKIESWLHRKFYNCRLNGEWFDLTDNDVIEFNSHCEKAENTINVLLKDNPYFN